MRDGEQFLIVDPIIRTALPGNGIFALLFFALMASAFMLGLITGYGIAS